MSVKQHEPIEECLHTLGKCGHCEILRQMLIDKNEQHYRQATALFIFLICVCILGIVASLVNA